MDKSEYNRLSFSGNVMNSYAYYPVPGDKPIIPLDRMQPIRLDRQRLSPLTGCLLGLLVLLIFMCIGGYFLMPIRTNMVVMGLDRAPQGSSISRTDTLILMTVVPTRPYVGMYSIPRDLWVDIPNVGQNRINTVHFFAEAEKDGSGPVAVRRLVEKDFGVKVPYYVRIRFDGVVKVIDALGGLTITLDTAQSGYEAGTHTLDGTKALAFVRDRKGSDDFFRMTRGQLAIKAVARQMINPLIWPRIPGAILAGLSSVDTNIPVWDWPRLGFAFLRAAITGFDAQTVTHDMVIPWKTDEGAQVLLPRWELILPPVQEMFKKM
ncbi:transcriptional attenuator, LytR family [Leptolinea tardivitalis]|nr:transcriptional attenuator, LytR family [Leptolinea tardivitalis]